MEVRRTVIILFLILLLQLVLRVPFLQEPLEGDEGVYAYIGQRILAGEVPYRDYFDHKPPVVYYINALIFKFFGDSLLSIRIFTAFYSLLTTLAVFAVGSLLWGKVGGLLSAGLYALFSGGPLVEGASSNTESFMILFLVLGLLFFLLGQKHKTMSYTLFAITGVFSGLAFMTKQVAIFNFLCLLGFVIIKDETFSMKIKQLLILLAGFLIFLVFFVIYFYFKGALGDFVSYAYLFNFGYIQTRLSWFMLFKTSYIALAENSVLWILAFAGVLWVLIRDRKHENLLVLSWGLFSFIGVLSGGFFFGHYYIQVMPFLSLISAYVLIKWIENRSVIGINILGAMVLFPFLILIVLNQWEFYFRYTPDEISFYKFNHSYNIIAREISKRLARVTSEKDYILTRGFPQIHFYTKRKSPCRYFYGLPKGGGRYDIYLFRKLVYSESYDLRIAPGLLYEEEKDFIQGLENKQTKFLVLFKYFDDTYGNKYKFEQYEFTKIFSNKDVVIYEKKRI